MPPKKYKKVLVLGSGAIKIGEAGEFDYSGSQALKSLKEENIEAVLVNPNIATIQTSEELADKIYFLPVQPYFVEQVIKKEKPDGIMLAFGGQTALNCGVALHDSGFLKKHHVEILGSSVETIKMTEDRALFAEMLDSIGVSKPNSYLLKSIDEVEDAIEALGFPMIARAEYALGGLGSGFAENKKQLAKLLKKLFVYNKQVLLDESVKGWKEVEYEVVRDKNNNCITVCNMENFDPVGIHTGDSIVVAPSQTLNDAEYQKLREISIRIVQHIGIVGECNVQFALDPLSEDYRVIEVNARLSRSSALASKATGYPLAYIAAKLGLDYLLPELKNPITLNTRAFFEPALDYVVCKFPRWDLDKFAGVDYHIGSGMKSVGEAMSIGRTFEEAFQKGIRMVDNGLKGFTANAHVALRKEIDEELKNPTDKRVAAIEKAFEAGYSVEKIHRLTQIDIWYLEKLQHIFEVKKQLESFDSIEDMTIEELRHAKQTGFSDEQIAILIYGEESTETHQANIRKYRKSKNIVPVVKQIDTLAAEFPAYTNYLYLTYMGDSNDIAENKEKESILTIGSGVYRIGSSVEFDWGCVTASKEIAQEGYSSVMVNCNPETVSTDYDLCDRLYFEELSLERILDIVDMESPKGICVSFGGQTSNNLAHKLQEENCKILGTCSSQIDKAESRDKFSKIMDELNISQPQWEEVVSKKSLKRFIEKNGYPILIRPSYVLSGTSMIVINDEEELNDALHHIHSISKTYPIVATQFISGAVELEFDGVAQNGRTIIGALSEHIENAGVHSGDATIFFPCQHVAESTQEKVRTIAETIADEFKITGPFNLQFLIKEDQIKVIELNLRSSRTFPFISKIMNQNLVALSVQAMLDQPLEPMNYEQHTGKKVGVKASRFSFQRLPGANPILSVDMVSTGEVGCIGTNKYEALLKAMLSVDYTLPQKGIFITAHHEKETKELLPSIRFLIKHAVPVYLNTFCGKQLQHLAPSIWAQTTVLENINEARELIDNKQIDFIISLPQHPSKIYFDEDYKLRRKAIDSNITVFSDISLSTLFIRALGQQNLQGLEIKSWDEY